MHRTSFKRPPLDGSLTVPELYDWNYEHNKNYPLFVYEDQPGHQRSVSIGVAIQGMHRATQYIRDRFDIGLRGTEPAKPPIVAILAASDTMTFFCTIIGALRTGVTIFLISPRNSVQAISFLLSETKPMGILVSSEPSIQQLAEDSIKISSRAGIQKAAMPMFEDLFPSTEYDMHFSTVACAKLEMNSPAIIYHSSGTASFPRPILWTHRALYWVSRIPFYCETDMSGSVLGCHFVAMFHAMGGLPLATAASVGVVIAIFKPQVPAVIPNPKNAIEGSVVTKVELLLSPPTFLEVWSQTPEYVDAISKMKGVVFGGAPLAKHVGDALASKGVNIFQNYGSTETLMINEFLPKEPGMSWDYFRLNPRIRVHLEEFGKNQFRVVAVATKDYTPLVVNAHVDGSDAYATDDLISSHPTKQGYYKIIGRVDDQIIHSNGEKTNAGPLETILVQDPNIERAVVFGRGRFQCGVLVMPSKEHSIDPSDAPAVLAFRNLIWASVEKVNAYAPTHSRMFKEMILVASREKPFEYTAKGTLRRQSVLDTYSVEIDAAYDAVEESAQPEITGPIAWTRGSTLQFMRDVIAGTMKKNIETLGKEDDLFEHGLDSLQATWIRNTITRILRESHPKLVHKLSPSFVYDHPTVSRLAEHIHAIVMCKDVSQSNKLPMEKAELLDLVKKYIGPFSEFAAIPQRQTGERVVLLTGSTGTLGSNLLAKLLGAPSFDRVVALSRPSPDGTVAERLSKAFEKEGLNKELLRSKRLKLSEGDPSRSDLGIDKDQLDELLSTVTDVIHNGWRVNFSNTVGSFESNIRSVRNFVDFCLRCKGEHPARLIFISSIGIFRQSQEVRPEEALGIEDVDLGSGYGESKWVSEEILNEASKQSASRITIIRPGQITGGTSGSWNEHEWFPSLVKSSVFLNKLPMIDGEVSWVTADVAAGAILDMLESEEHVLHLVHPHPIKWSEMIAWFSKVLDVPVVSSEEWIDALEQTRASVDPARIDKIEATLQRNPALRLLEMFSPLMRAKEQTFEPRLGSEKAQKASGTLREAEPLRERNVEGWISRWRKTGFLQ